MRGFGGISIQHLRTISELCTCKGEFEEGFFKELTTVWMILFLGIWVNIKLGSELIKGALNGV